MGNRVKEAIRKGIVSREDLFITSKIMPGDYRRADAAIDDSLSALGVEYIDLMLIHQPGANDEEVYKALERGVRAGKIRSIGISNYHPGSILCQSSPGLSDIYRHPSLCASRGFHEHDLRSCECDAA